MDVEKLALEGVLLIRPRTFADERGYFLEIHHDARYREAGVPGPFVQDNLSWSHRGVVRGLHFQNPNGQGKLVMAMAGTIFDVAVDIRRGSPTFGRWVSALLTAEGHEQLYIPAGFAHGFCVVSETALVSYKCAALYDPKAEATVLFADPDLAIAWPTKEPIVSAKDRAGVYLRDIAPEKLPAA